MAQELAEIVGKIIVYGHSRTDRDCTTPEDFKDYIADRIFSRSQGRYPQSQSKEAVTILLSLGGLIYGRFDVAGKEPLTDQERSENSAWKCAYIVESSKLYPTPVRLSDYQISGIQFGKSVSPEKLEEIERAAGLAPTVNTPILFLRIGWMRFYRGQSPDDEITGGGQFVREHGYGHEMFNFLDSDGHVYGYVRPTSGGSTQNEFVDGAGIKLERIVASAKRQSSLAGVLVIWVSTHPEGGTFIVGWYRNATVYRDHQPPPSDSNRKFNGEKFGFYVSARSEDATLLDIPERLFRNVARISSRNSSRAL